MKKITYLALFLVLLFSIPVAAHADTLSAGCVAGDTYSPTTGHLCVTPLRDCAPGDLFSAKTGEPCATSTLIPGCFSTNGFSVETGEKCDGSLSTITSSAPVQTEANQTAPMENDTTVTTPNTDTVAPDTDENDTVNNSTVSIHQISASNANYVVEVTDADGNSTIESIMPDLNTAEQAANQYCTMNGITTPVVINQ